jgi:Holliday junction resolvasome RuvABC DNA-binding subunit
LFICSSEQKNLKEIIDLLKDHSVLTVADMQGFLESGGIVNFVIEENKVGFEINIAAAEHAKLKIRSQLLRLAKRIVEEDVIKKT